MIDILWPIARAADGQMTKIEDVVPGATGYRCLECDGSMVARLGEVRQHHFAHHSGTGGDCTGESAIHAIAKHLLAYELESRGVIRFQTGCRGHSRLGCFGQSCQTVLHYLKIARVDLEKQLEGIVRFWDMRAKGIGRS